jgi:hypothetical protein
MELKYPDGKVVIGSFTEIAQLLKGKVEKENGSGKRCHGCGELLTGQQQRWCGSEECQVKANIEYNRNWKRIKAMKNKPRLPNGKRCATCGGELVGHQLLCCGKKECAKIQAIARNQKSLAKKEHSQGDLGISAN